MKHMQGSGMRLGEQGVFFDENTPSPESKQ